MQERIEDKRRRLPLLERSLRNAVCVAFDPFRECFGAARGPRANIPDPTAAPHDENDSLLGICRTEISPPSDSKEWERKPDKLQYFSPNPGTGD
jgi:hypothetical protein